HVAPLAGAWIEIANNTGIIRTTTVAPLAGAWIEIYSPPYISRTDPVAPLAGAWIEIFVTRFASDSLSSLPLRERGLKYLFLFSRRQAVLRRSPCGSVD